MQDSSKDDSLESIDQEQQDELFEHHRINVDDGQQPLRIDKFLMDRLPNTSRNKIQNAAIAGSILANERPVKANYKVKPGDILSVVLPYPPREIELIPENIEIDIVYEDEDVVVINKGANRVVHPGYGNYSGTLVNGLIYHFQNLPSSGKGKEEPRPGLVHRLDKNTTGLMAIAKTELALTKLAKQFYDRTVERKYIVLVWGDIKDDKGSIKGNIGRSLKNRKVMSVFPNGDQGKKAITHYEVIERFGYVTLIECKLETGRTHQIRVHLKHIGNPVFGDYEYGGDKIVKGLPSNKYNQFVKNCFDILPRQALHARVLGFKHPSTGEHMTFSAEMPDDMLQVVEKWRKFVGSRAE